jgi:hypothetical protein
LPSYAGAWHIVGEIHLLSSPSTAVSILLVMAAFLIETTRIDTLWATPLVAMDLTAPLTAVVTVGLGT